MLIKSLEARCTGCVRGIAVLLMLAAASRAWAAPCDRPERLCAPDGANTSAAAAAASSRVPVLLAAADPELATAARQAAAARRNAEAAGTAPAIDTPAGNASADSTPAPTTPVRIALLLPMRSATLGAAADAVRSGFMAGFERDGAGFKVELVSTGDTPQDTLDAYARAAASDIVVGPLARPAVTALAAGNGVTRPTVALNTPEGGAPDRRVGGARASAGPRAGPDRQRRLVAARRRRVQLALGAARPHRPEQRPALD
jgi:hypothetical protein